MVVEKEAKKIACTTSEINYLSLTFYYSLQIHTPSCHHSPCRQECQCRQSDTEKKGVSSDGKWLEYVTWGLTSQGCSSLVGFDKGAENLRRLWQSQAQKLKLFKIQNLFFFILQSYLQLSVTQQTRLSRHSRQTEAAPTIPFTHRKTSGNEKYE